MHQVSPEARPLTAIRSVVVVSDFIEFGNEDLRSLASSVDRTPYFGSERFKHHNFDVEVAGSYLERLPLSLLASKMVEQAEIWHYFQGEGVPSFQRHSHVLARRAFRIDGTEVPYSSRAMENFVREFGAPDILVVLGLGVTKTLLELCRESVVIYNSIDAPALRVSPDVSEHFDIVLTGAEWQSAVVRDRHPHIATAILPIGPEFAAIDQFRPLGTPKDIDLIYVAAAQPYKRHDILFDALAKLPRDVRTLCVFGYGEMADELRERAATMGLAIEFVGPPGVAIDEVNILMNRARFGVVCGVDDGAPAILTEYMLAGLPVLANADLSCGLQYVLPETGITATAEGFADAIMTLRETAPSYSPREIVLDRWAWPHSVARLNAIIRKIMMHSKDLRQSAA